MDMKDNFYVPMLCYVDENKMDIGGNVYPQHGLIIASKFTDDINIETGLYGILWGEMNNAIYEKIEKGYWAVVKTADNKALIPIDKGNNRYKFKSGLVLYLGALRGAGEFIWNNRNAPYHLFNSKKYIIQKRDIAGTKPWLEINEKKWLNKEKQRNVQKN